MFWVKEVVKEVIVQDDKKIRELQLEIDDLYIKMAKNTADHLSKEKILKNELNMQILQAKQAEVDKNNKLQEENSVLRKEVEILTKAFENMGFDVKDMKNILNKLVDGIVSKNSVNVIR